MLALANAHGAAATFPHMARHESEQARNERLRRKLEQLRDERFGGNLSATARALGITPPTLSDILKQKRGVGLDVLVRLADFFSESLDVLVFGRPHPTVTLLVKDDRYEARAQARARARRIFDRADELIVGDLYARAEDKPVEWWMRRIEEAQLEARRELEDPEGAERARSSARARAAASADEDEAAMEAAAREDAALPRRQPR